MADNKATGANAGSGTGRTGSSGGGGGTPLSAATSTARTTAGARDAASSASNGSAAKPAQRSTGISFRKETDVKFAGLIKHRTSAKLEKFRKFCRQVEGFEPDNDEVLESALDALFARAKGFSTWLKEDETAQLDREVDSAFENLIPAPHAGGGGSTGASTAS